MKLSEEGCGVHVAESTAEWGGLEGHERRVQHHALPIVTPLDHRRRHVDDLAQLEVRAPFRSDPHILLDLLDAFEELGLGEASGALLVVPLPVTIERVVVETRTDQRHEARLLVLFGERTQGRGREEEEEEEVERRWGEGSTRAQRSTRPPAAPTAVEAAHRTGRGPQKNDSLLFVPEEMAM